MSLSRRIVASDVPQKRKFIPTTLCQLVALGLLCMTTGCTSDLESIANTERAGSSDPLCLQTSPWQTDPVCPSGSILNIDYVVKDDYCCVGSVVSGGGEGNEGDPSTVQHKICDLANTCPAGTVLIPGSSGPDCQIKLDDCGLAGYDTDPTTGECVCGCEETFTPPIVSQTGALGCQEGEVLVSDPLAGQACGSCGIPCRSVTHPISNEPTRVLLVLDRSGSMGNRFEPGEPPSRWAVAKQAVESIVTNGQLLEFGLQMFPLSGTTCGANQIHIPVANQTSSEIISLMDSSNPNFGSTPLATALNLAYSQGFNNPPTSGRKAIILVSDGLNFGCGGTNNQILSAAKDSYETFGITTHPVSVINDPTVQQFLDALARFGGTQSAHHPDNPQELVDNLQQSLDTASCSFSLPELPSDVPQIHVTIDGQIVPERDWHIVGDKIIIENAWCYHIKQGNVESITIDADCPQPPPT